jgi:hypothetical protein
MTDENPTTKRGGRYDARTLGRIYDALAKYAGSNADEYERNAFVRCALDWDYHCAIEYRFQGRLGFGGKVWLSLEEDPKVSYYPEDETPERKKTAEKINEELRRLLDETGARR